MNVEAVIFDRDHTLVHLAPQQLQRAQGRLFAVAAGLRLDAVQAAWAAWPGPWPRTPADEPAFWRAFAAALIRENALSAAEGTLADELGELYHTFSAAYPDARPALAALRAAGLRLAVLSNFELPSIGPPLVNAGIELELFDYVVSSAAIGWAKPHPRSYLAVAEALGVAPEACWFVDDLDENVAGARLVGMRAFKIDRISPGDPAGEVLGSLLDLIELLPATPERPGSPSRGLTAYD